MPTGRWEHIQRIFAEAASRPEAERAKYLDEACGGDEVLRAEVESLLDHHADAPPGFLDEPPTADAPTVAIQGSDGGTAGDPNVGRRIGRYRITERIASGGMGTVYLAVQEQPRRTVALKLMKRGVTSRSALRRFEFEAQLLARLRHPGIAQVYEAGTHDDGEGGVPFFAMEYVPGAMTLLDFAAQKKLDTRQRLGLFARVCDAVGHGHQKGIIHRDLKPGNILVDGTGQPKIIDFGVARATDSDMAVTTLQTHLRQLIGTLQYMSPEQCRGDSLDLDVRSDVYSLGAVLYEMLCGSRPYDISDAAIPAAITIICEQEPARPSTVDRTLRGDVETIALKAMEKERERRYRNADDLGDDVRRHLNDEPIEARPPGVVDAIKRFARKHTAAAVGLAGAFAVVAAVAVVFVALWGTTRLALMEAEQARTETEEANRQAAAASRDLWASVSASGPGAWADTRAAELAEAAREEAATAASAYDASRFGSAASSFIEALATWQNAIQRHEGLVPSLIEDGLAAAAAERDDETLAAYERAKSLGVADDVLEPLAAEVSLLRMEMVGIPVGSFRMGDESMRDARPVHEVTIAQQFLLSATEVTQGQFLAVMGRNPSSFQDGPLGERLERPVERVTWFDAIDFCNRLSERKGLSPRYHVTAPVRSEGGVLQDAQVTRVDGTGYRLPTEAEWEYACRAGTETAFSFGDGNDARIMNEHMWYRANSDNTTHPVAALKPNAFGLFDMHGNVWEWCEDPWHEDYGGAPDDGSVRMSGGQSDGASRVLRGGSWLRNPRYCRSADRGRGRPDGRNLGDGFRVALDPN